MKPLTHLKNLRKERKLTQIQLQMEVSIEQSILSKFETGERSPTIEQLEVLADFFHTSLDYLMDRTDVREPYPENPEK